MLKVRFMSPRFYHLVEINKKEFFTDPKIIQKYWNVRDHESNSKKITFTPVNVVRALVPGIFSFKTLGTCTLTVAALSLELDFWLGTIVLGAFSLPVAIALLILVPVLSLAFLTSFEGTFPLPLLGTKAFCCVVLVWWWPCKIHIQIQKINHYHSIIKI